MSEIDQLRAVADAAVAEYEALRNLTDAKMAHLFHGGSAEILPRLRWEHDAAYENLHTEVKNLLTTQAPGSKVRP